MAKVIVFANQKGGVGKSTLAILTANSLAHKGKDIGVVEVDVQRSISNKRLDDIRFFGEEEMLYEVRYQVPKSIEEASEMMNRLKSFQSDCIFLIDLPGKIDENYIAPFLVYADYIICPFQYESMCLASTTVFIRVITQFKKDFSTDPHLIFVPNNIDTRIGTKAEKAGWKEVDEIMSRYGAVAPSVPALADLRRLNTYENTPRQEEASFQYLNYIEKLTEVNV